ncbi:MAG: hypothetical protein LBC80_05890 [Treponema sp.]|jgi:hypothetical protein|nr:hypothetical protein [Treponema sp.]
MAENGQINYIDTLGQVLEARKEWLEHTELGKFKEELRVFHTSFATLYNIYLKKKLIDEDPYKQEAKISEIEVPDSSSFPEVKRIEQLTIRLANYDNQLDFLVNFYQLGVDFLNLDRMKRIVGLVRYIDWVSFSADSQSMMTRSVVYITNQSKVGVDAITLGIISESLSRLSKTTNIIMRTIKDLSTYYRERYKLDIRKKITQSMSASDATLENIRKKAPTEMPGQPFYRELIEEIIKEDYSPSGIDLRDAILNSLRIVDDKPKIAKQVVDFKAILLDGIQVIGNSSSTLAEIVSKFDENQAVMESRKKGFLEKLKDLIKQMTKAEPDPVIYIVEYPDGTKGLPLKEKLNFHQFRDELEKRGKILSSLARGPAYNKLAVMTEDQIIVYLEKYIKEIQNLHRTISALDDFFKTNVLPEGRDKIKGVKPELSALKNSFVKANQLRYEYSAQKEADEQMKNLGINPVIQPAAEAPPPQP